MAGRDSSSEEQRACYLEQSSMACRSEGKHPRESAEAPGATGFASRAVEMATRSVRLQVAEQVQRQDRWLHARPDQKHVQEEKWSSECARSLGKCLARRNGSSKNAGVLDFAKATGSDENLIEDTDEMDADRAIQYRILHDWGKSKKVKNLLAPSGQRCRNKVTVPKVRMRAERGSNAFGRTTH